MASLLRREIRDVVRRAELAVGARAEQLEAVRLEEAAGVRVLLRAHAVLALLARRVDADVVELPVVVRAPDVRDRVAPRIGELEEVLHLEALRPLREHVAVGVAQAFRLVELAGAGRALGAQREVEALAADVERVGRAADVGGQLRRRELALVVGELVEHRLHLRQPVLRDADFRGLLRAAQVRDQEVGQDREDQEHREHLDQREPRASLVEALLHAVLPRRPARQCARRRTTWTLSITSSTCWPVLASANKPTLTSPLVEIARIGKPVATGMPSPLMRPVESEPSPRRSIRSR